MEGPKASLTRHDDMAGRVMGDYKNTEEMIFGEAPSFDAILTLIGALEDQSIELDLVALKLLFGLLKRLG